MNTTDPTYLKQAIEQLRRKGIRFLPGLTDKEVLTVESRWNFIFPDDLRTFLQLALPVQRTALKGLIKKDFVFPNWRSTKAEDIEYIESRMNWSVQMLLFDVEHNTYWEKDWKQRPPDLEQAKKLATQYINAAPKLIPIYSHRFIPSVPTEAGNPVFSMYGFDTIYYGFDLADYLANEFGIDKPEWAAKRPKKIDFWWQFDPIIEFKYGLNLDFEANWVYLIATTEMAINQYGDNPINLSHLNIPETYIRILQEWLEKVRPLYNSKQKTIHWSEDLFQEFWGAVQTICNQINHDANNEYFIFLQTTETLINATKPFVERKLGKRNK